MDCLSLTEFFPCSSLSPSLEVFEMPQKTKPSFITRDSPFSTGKNPKLFHELIPDFMIQLAFLSSGSSATTFMLFLLHWCPSHQIQWPPTSWRAGISGIVSPLGYTHALFDPGGSFKEVLLTGQSWTHLWNASDTALLSWSLHWPLQQTKGFLALSSESTWNAISCT